VAAKITDNDTAGVTVAPASGLAITGQGGTATFTIVLNSQPTADVTIGLSSSSPDEGTVSPASVTFTPANWNVPQEVTVTLVDRQSTVGRATFRVIALPAVSADPAYNSVHAADIEVTDERPPDDVMIEIRRITRHGICGPIGYFPFLTGIPCLLGIMAQRRLRATGLPCKKQRETLSALREVTRCTGNH
jgi:hypothetical protein